MFIVFFRVDKRVVNVMNIQFFFNFKNLLFFCSLCYVMRQMQESVVENGFMDSQCRKYGVFLVNKVNYVFVVGIVDFFVVDVEVIGNLFMFVFVG